MSTVSKWLIQGRVIHTEFSGLLTLDHLKAENEILREMIRQGTPDQMVHHVADTGTLQRFPLNFRMMADALTFTQEPNMGWQIGVGMSPKVQQLIRLVAQTARFQLLYAHTLEEALELLRKMDESLASLIEPPKPKQTGVYPLLHADDSD